MAYVMQSFKLSQERLITIQVMSQVSWNSVTGFKSYQDISIYTKFNTVKALSVLNGTGMNQHFSQYFFAVP